MTRASSYSTMRFTRMFIACTREEDVLSCFYCRTNITDSPSSGGNAPQSGSPGDGASQNGHKTNVGAIVGGVVGGVGLIVICIIALLLYRRRQNVGVPQTADEFKPEPFSLSKPRPPPASTVADSEFSAPLSSVFVTANKDPSVPDDHLSDSDRHTSSVDDESSVVPLQQQLQFFRTELAAIRSRTSSSPSKPVSSPADSPRDNQTTLTTPRTAGTSSIIPSLANEIASLRRELTELRSQQEINSRPTPPQNSNSDGLQRDIDILRSEIEELRLQQLGPLPEYSPPPPQPLIPRRLPGPPAPQQ